MAYPDQIVSFDPGVTTGFAIWHKTKVIAFGEIPFSNLGMIDTLLDIKPQHSIVLIEHVRSVVDGFDERGIEVMGVIKFLAARKNLETRLQLPMVMQGPQRWPGVNLTKIKSPHSRDAVFHILAYLHKTDYVY